ncbi:MAG TPA: hypothetical protein VKA49_04335 [Flavitalea sp.]|nr:hypothetical protein [Flavitalea sp.]
MRNHKVHLPEILVRRGKLNTFPLQVILPGKFAFSTLQYFLCLTLKLGQNTGTQLELMGGRNNPILIEIICQVLNGVLKV